MKLVFISDTHCLHHQIEVPDGDILLHCGDFSGRGRVDEVTDFMNWFGAQPHRYKVCIAGNHDFLAEREPALFRLLIPKNVIYLEDSGVEIEGLHIWGSPIQPWFFDWAFNRQRGAEIRKHWDMIPENTDVLITHGPPYGILDRVASDNRPVGCRDLLKRVSELPLKINAFGHIHEGYGMHEENGATFINASSLDEHYKVRNAAVVVESGKWKVESLKFKVKIQYRPTGGNHEKTLRTKNRNVMFITSPLTNLTTLLLNNLTT